MAALSASAGLQTESTCLQVVKMISYLSGPLQNQQSWLGAKATSLGSQLSLSIHGDVMIRTTDLEVLVKIADFCYGISAWACCVVQKLYVESSFWNSVY